MINRQPVAIAIEDRPEFTVQALGNPAEDGLHSTYQIIHKNNNAPGVSIHAFKFQVGDPKDVGVNGVTEELVIKLLQYRFKNTDLLAYEILESLLLHLQSTDDN